MQKTKKMIKIKNKKMQKIIMSPKKKNQKQMRQ